MAKRTIDPAVLQKNEQLNKAIRFAVKAPRICSGMPSLWAADMWSGWRTTGRKS